MDKEKLNKAADMLAGDTYDAESRLCFIDGVVACADWLMQQPLSDRLTDEEKEKIINMHGNTVSFRLCSTNPIMIGLFLSLQTIIEDIFGADLFNPNQPTAI